MARPLDTSSPIDKNEYCRLMETFSSPCSSFERETYHRLTEAEAEEQGARPKVMPQVVIVKAPSTKYQAPLPPPRIIMTVPHFRFASKRINEQWKHLQKVLWTSHRESSKLLLSTRGQQLSRLRMPLLWPLIASSSIE